LKKCLNKIVLPCLAVLAASTLAFAQDAVVNGSVTGEVRIVNGKVSNGKDVKIVEYTGPCGRKTPASTIHLWKSRVMDVTLWLTRADGSIDGDAGKLITQLSGVDIKGERCEFNPPFVVARPGSVIRITNEDPITQWIIIDEQGARKRQVMLENGGPPLEIEVKEDREIYLLSAFYPWMEAWIKPMPALITTTQTTWDGRFYMNDIPAGDYLLHAWHLSLGESVMPITVTADEETDVDVKFNKPDKRVPIMEASMLEELFRNDSPEKNDNPFKTKD